MGRRYVGAFLRLLSKSIVFLKERNRPYNRAVSAVEGLFFFFSKNIG